MAAKSCGRNPQIVDQFLDGNLQRAAKPATRARRSFLGLQVVWFRFHPWLVLLRHESSSGWHCHGAAARTSRQGFDERSDQAQAHGGDRVGDVAFRPRGQILWVDNCRLIEMSGTAWRNAVLRGESS